MGLNITGITISKNFDKDPEKAMIFIGMPVTYEREIDFKTVSGITEGKYIDFFFSDKGTSIFTFEPFVLAPALSENTSILYYAISEPSLLYYMALDENGKRVREVFDNEGIIEKNVGNTLEVENDRQLKDSIIEQQGKMFGLNYYQMPPNFTGYRYKLSDVTQKDIHSALFYDRNSLASNPGRLSLNVVQWIKMNFFPILRKTCLLLLFFFLMIKVHWIFFILFLGSLLHNTWYWFMAYNTFKAGDVNPGKVISLNPDLIAVATNMSKFMGNYPILKIVKTNLTKFEKEKGMFIPTVALYKDNPHKYPFWAEFHPVPVSHGTSDRGTLKERFNTFSDEDFKRIDTYLKEVNSLQEGTYKVEKTSSGWKDYPDVEIGAISEMKAPVKKNEV